MSRAELEQEVDRLAGEHEGEAFAAAVRELAEGLDQDERDELAAILLERAGTVEWAISERSRAKGWFRRMLDPARRR